MTEQRKIPRFTFDKLPETIAERLRPKYERLGYLGEFFAATAHQEGALAAFIDFTEASKGGLEMRIVELIALTVSCMKGVDYERNQHERLAVKLGLSTGWVAEVERLEPDAAGLEPDERIVQRFVILAVESDGSAAAAALEDVVVALGHQEAVAVMMVMARYVAHALLVNCLEIAAPVPSIFPSRPDRARTEEPS